tara:strand:+ start:96 stop:386 length:291 start_codon:yes stop_codon:yes gene_type:complete
MKITKKKVITIIIIQISIIIAFTGIYMYIGDSNLHHRKKDNIKGNLTVLDYFYFSTVTSASTGFGDIIPDSDLARLLVTIQIILTYTTIIRFFFID